MVCKWLKNVEWGSLESTLLESGYNQHQRLASESALKIRLIRTCAYLKILVMLAVAHFELCTCK